MVAEEGEGQLYSAGALFGAVVVHFGGQTDEFVAADAVVVVLPVVVDVDYQNWKITFVSLFSLMVVHSLDRNQSVARILHV